MRSRDADRFNHDADAPHYDREVADESSLIRRGYAACIRALAEDLRRGPGPEALPITDLGTGTGALAHALPAKQAVVAVDISGEMLARAGTKLAGRPVTFVQGDLLAYITDAEAPLGSVGSTFALHHLHPDEKTTLLEALARRLAPGARICIGDLGFADNAAKEAFLASSDATVDITEAVVDEYFWDWSEAESTLRGLGFKVRRRSHGPLISSLVAVREDAVKDGDDSTSAK